MRSKERVMVFRGNTPTPRAQPVYGVHERNFTKLRTSRRWPSEIVSSAKCNARETRERKPPRGKTPTAVGGSASTVGRAVVAARAQRRGERAIVESSTSLAPRGVARAPPKRGAAYRRALPRCFWNPRPPAGGVAAKRPV